MLDLKAGHGHGVDHLLSGGGGVQVIPEPGEREFH